MRLHRRRARIALSTARACNRLDPDRSPQAFERGDVVLFQFEADRRPLAAEMLAAAIIQDLVAITAGRQRGRHWHGLVVIDEFSALGVPRVAALFSRARNAKLRVLVGTQEITDLKSAGLIAATRR